MNEERPNIFGRLPEGIVLLLLAVAALDFIRLASMVIPFPYPVDYGEAAMLNQTVLLARLETPYRPDIDNPPYVVWNFPALFSLVQVPACLLFGPSLWYGRLLSVLSALVAAGSVGFTLHQITRDRLAAIVGGMSLLAIPMVSFWASLNRVDSLALGLSWLGLALLVAKPSWRWSLVVVGGLLTAAIYTRQSYGLAAPMAALLWLFVERSPREAGRLLLILFGSGLGLLLLLNWWTEGGFLLHIVFANINEYRPQILRDLFYFLLVLMPVFFAVGALFLVCQARHTRAWFLGAPYLLGATASALTAGKVGSNVNYFFELFAGLGFAAGALLAQQRGARRKILLVLFGAQFGLLLLFHSPQQAEVNVRLGATKELEKLERMIERADGPVLADEYLAMLPISGKDVYFQPFIFTQLSRLGKWDQRPLLKDIEAQKFPLIVLRDAPDNPMTAEWWTDEMRQAIDRYYEVSETLAPIGVRVHQPKALDRS